MLVTVGSALLYCVLRVNNAAGTFTAHDVWRITLIPEEAKGQVFRVFDLKTPFLWM